MKPLWRFILGAVAAAALLYAALFLFVTVSTPEVELEVRAPTASRSPTRPAPFQTSSDSMEPPTWVAAAHRNLDEALQACPSSGSVQMICESEVCVVSSERIGMLDLSRHAVLHPAETVTNLAARWAGVPWGETRCGQAEQRFHREASFVRVEPPANLCVMVVAPGEHPEQHRALADRLCGEAEAR